MGTGNSGGAFLAGAGLALLGAVVHNVAKDERHQRELDQAYWQGFHDERRRCQRELFVRDIEIAGLKAQIVLLHTAVELQTKALSQKPQQPRNALPPGMGLWSENGNGHDS